jgi:hypothetical protein
VKVFRVLLAAALFALACVLAEGARRVHPAMSYGASLVFLASLVVISHRR